MAKEKRIFPQLTNEFSEYINRSFNYIKKHKRRFKVDKNTFNLLETAIYAETTGYNALFTIHSSASTKKKPQTKMLKDSTKKVTALFRYIHFCIPRNVLTLVDYYQLNMTPPGGKKTPKEFIKDSPIVKLISLAGAYVQFIVRVPNASGRPFMHPMADVICVYGIILKPGENLPNSPKDCNIVFTSTRAIFRHQFGLDQAGNRFVCFVQYANQSNQAKSGPFTSMQMCIINM